ncbi:Subtilisin-like protease SBT1.4 [Thalictrum thalictroides]|uniref:Subtilisin-like protease SBT1.4 n=1 Tax=Thalictrum thalictroides TaxID=46969 RepID=A0A7J6V5C3_THATH|nr:Subtilisin-like protease SBT1.4 [Thalictrum thalictroides]
MSKFLNLDAPGGPNHELINMLLNSSSKGSNPFYLLWLQRENCIGKGDWFDIWIGPHLASRVAVYKFCWKDDCDEGDILAAMEQAVDDGVDIISISIGRGSGLEYVDDAFAVGALRAVQKRILVTCSAGNDGLKTKNTPCALEFK